MSNEQIIKDAPIDVEYVGGSQYAVCVSKTPIPALHLLVEPPNYKVAVKALEQALDRLVLPLLECARREGAAEALANDLPGAPMSEEEVAKLESKVNEAHAKTRTTKSVAGALTHVFSPGVFLPLFAHIRWLTRIVHDLSLDDVGEAYRSGCEVTRKEYEKRLAELEQAHSEEMHRWADEDTRRWRRRAEEYGGENG